MKHTIRKMMAVMAIALVAAVMLTACGVDITRVGIPADVTVEKGETYQLTVDYGTDDQSEADAIAKAASKLTLVWTSSDDTIATVDETGLVTATGAGEADITVSTEGANISSTCHITVVVTPTGVDAPAELALVINGEDSKTLNAKMTPEDATGVKLAYVSSDENVATVDENGKVTAVADGECTITTSVVADTGTLEIAQEPVASDETAPAPAEDTAEVEPLDPEMMVVPEGLSAETKVTVATAATGIRLEATGSTLYVGNTATITAYTVPSEAAASTYTYVSSDDKIATVDANGKVTAKSVGTATITVTSAEGHTADYKVTVKAKATGTTNKTTTSNNGAGATTTPSTTPSGGSSGGGTAPAPAPTNPDPAPAPTNPDPAPTNPDPAPGGGDNGGGEPGYGGLPTGGGTIIPGDGNGVDDGCIG